MTFDENILWLKFKSGDADALGEIFHNYFHDLYFYGLKFIPVPDIVKDVIQEMFVKFWSNKEKLKHVRNIKSYLLVSFRRELIHLSKNNKQEFRENEIYANDFTISPEDLIIELEGRKEFNHKLALSFHKLSPRQREVLFLRFYNNLDFNELSDVLEMNVQSVRNLLFRSLEILRKDLSGLTPYSVDSLEIE